MLRNSNVNNLGNSDCLFQKLAVLKSRSVPFYQCRSGACAAWNSLYQLYGASLEEYAFSLCYDEDTAHDIARQVFDQLYEHLESKERRAA